MADMSFGFECCAKPTVEFSGTVDELIEFARKYNGDKPAEIEGPVRVGDTIEITETTNPNLKVGDRFEVTKVGKYGYPETRDYIFHSSKYRIVSRKEETPQPAKTPVKVGDYIVFDEGNPYITEGRAYKVVGVNSEGEPKVFDDYDDTVTAGGFAPKKYRIITDARELAFAKAGRKLGEFKTGDIVRGNTTTGDIEVVVGEVAHESVGAFTIGVRVFAGGRYRALDRNETHLIAPAEARVDGE